MPLATSIARVEVVPVDLPLAEPFAIAGGAQHVCDIALCRVTLGDGSVGHGEAAPFRAVSGETRDRSLATMRDLARDLVGRDAREHARISGELAERAMAEPAARAGLEMAIVDALARSFAAPIWALYGGAGPRSFATDITITAGGVDHAASAARTAHERGFTTLKVKIGAADPGVDVERVCRVADAAPGAAIVLDANEALDAKGAIQLLATLATRGVSVAAFEQPVPAADLDGLAEVTRAAGKTRVLADESARSARDVARIVRTGAAHGINVKITKCGVAESVSMWIAARAAGLDVMIGGMVETDLAMGFSAQLVRGIGGVTFADLDTPFFLGAPLTQGGITFTRPLLEVPDGPGSGATIAGERFAVPERGIP
jgi:L-alanine-DL-glutamate epimerase-like enolase superfamily enzyme